MSETTAAQQLAELEARILDGETVDPAELAAARAAVDVETLADTGRRRRAEAESAAAAAQAIADAKAHAIAARQKAEGLPEAADALLEARDALRRMIGHLDAYNAVRDAAINRMIEAKVPTDVPGLVRRAWPAEIDQSNHITLSPNTGQITGAVVDGTGWNPEHAHDWVGALLRLLGVRLDRQASPNVHPVLAELLEEAK